MSEFKKFPSIGGFANMMKWRNKYLPNERTGKVRAKIKLHGTNAAVRLSANGVVAQSRSRDLTPLSDNYGFANWVANSKSDWDLYRPESEAIDIVVFGEWAGPGIQKSVAVSQIPEKSFFVFAVCVIDRYLETVDYLLEPKNIATYIPEGMSNIHVLPWYGETKEVDFFSEKDVTGLADYLNSEVDSIDEVDPYIEELFGVVGVGEGLVGYLIADTAHTGSWFKVKGSKHTVNDEKKIAKVRKMAGQEYYDLADAFFTPGRIEQALQELGVEYDRQHTGAFISWVCKDVIKESQDECEELQIDRKLFSGIIAKKAREHFLSNC